MTTDSAAPEVPATCRAPSSKALVVVPGSVNEFYDHAGERLAEALRGLGLETTVATLAQTAGMRPDLTFVVNPQEIAVAAGGAKEARRPLTHLRRASGVTAAVLLECVETKWFRQSCQVAAAVGIDVILDLGLHDQRRAVPSDIDIDYRFVFNGLTRPERASRPDSPADPAHRPLPWTVIGHAAPVRTDLVESLVAHDPRGFVYLPRLSPVSAGGPHLSGAQVDRILRRSVWQVWTSHHEHFYLEGERFRQSYLNGSIPLKVTAAPAPDASSLPFAEHVTALEHLGDALGADPSARWASFATEVESSPTLEDGLEITLPALVAS